MAIDGDDMISLPSPPPPRPAARREAIDAALRKFDGLEQPQARQRRFDRARRPWLAAMNRRPAGALVAVAILALVSIPAIQIALRDRPPGAISDDRPPSVAQPDQISDQQPPPIARQADDGRPPVGGRAAPLSPPSTALARTADTGRATVARVNEQKIAAEPPATAIAAPAPLSIAPPPPPPPPPPPEPEADASDSGSIVVTGSRVRSPNLDSASPVTVIEASGGFLSDLQEAFEAHDRRAVLRLVAIPLRVSFPGGRRTYHSSRDVERDYDRIFTPAVRQAAIAMQPDTLQSRDGGRLRGNNRLWFGCGKPSCASETSVRIREVSP